MFMRNSVSENLTEEIKQMLGLPFMYMFGSVERK